MRTLTTLFSMMALSLSLGCGGGDGDDPVADANPGSNPDADTSNQPDAMPMGGGGAANLGKFCDQATPCATGTCAVLTQGATSGFCTLTCTTPGMVDVCGAADGFPGPGLAYCGLGQMPPHSCAVGCGEQNMGDTNCPGGMTCQDLIDVNGTPDLCAPPPM